MDEISAAVVRLSEYWSFFSHTCPWRDLNRERLFLISASRIKNTTRTWSMSTRWILGRGVMAQHFLLSAAARTLSRKDIYARGRGRRVSALLRAALARDERSARVCPRCESRDAYEIATRRKFRCKHCHRQFSVTSGTIFASRKLSFADLPGASALVVNAAKGISASARTAMQRDQLCVRQLGSQSRWASSVHR